MVENGRALRGLLFTHDGVATGRADGGETGQALRAGIVRRIAAATPPNIAGRGVVVRRHSHTQACLAIDDKIAVAILAKMRTRRVQLANVALRERGGSRTGEVDTRVEVERVAFETAGAGVALVERAVIAIGRTGGTGHVDIRSESHRAVDALVLAVFRQFARVAVLEFARGRAFNRDAEFIVGDIVCEAVGAVKTLAVDLVAVVAVGLAGEATHAVWILVEFVVTFAANAVLVAVAAIRGAGRSGRRGVACASVLGLVKNDNTRIATIEFISAGCGFCIRLFVAQP